MQPEYTDEQRALREELRDYMQGIMTPELEQELDETHGGGPLYMEAVRQLGQDGWLGIGWPEEYGGQERGAIDQFIFFDEVQASGFPVPILTLGTVGPMLLEHGTDEQKDKYCRAITRGECHFSIGYTEPQSGTDLASLKTSAKLEGDEFVINGQKIWTSLADHADYIWLAAKTDPDAPPHKGISIIIVPTDSDGIEITKIRALGENNVHAVYYDDVRVPRENLVGELHGGWGLITGQLNHERVALNAVGPTRRLARQTREWAADMESAPGESLLDKAWVRSNLAEVEAGLDVLEMMNLKQAWAIQNEQLSMAEASAIKVFGSEFYVRASRLLLEVLGAAGTVKYGSPGAVLQGEVERYYRTSLVLTFGGGTNEVQRDIIAMAGLRMPRAGR
jgi:alkylation response protein AidB-like acyl-CoA dehydrogenase